MYIARLRIFGFRGIREADLRFGRQTVLVGPNGCGKSTVVDALSLVLGRPKMVRSLTEHDFFGSDPAPSARIRIIVTVVGFSSTDPTDHDDWFRLGRAVPKWMDDKGNEHSTRDEAFMLCANLGFVARFDRDELEVATIRYFHDDDDQTDPFDDDGAYAVVPARLVTDAGYYVLPARRSWDAVASFNSELFRRTVSNTAGIPSDEVLAQRDRLRNPPSRIEDSPKLKTLVDGMNQRLSRLLSGAPRFGLRVTAGDAEAVLQALLPHYSTPTASLLPAARHGTGLVSLQSLLLLLEVGRARRAKDLSFIFALEEPELHLSPGLQGRLVAEAAETADQVICTTHSPEVARVFAPTNTLILTNQAGLLSARPFLAAALTTDASNNERKLFVQNRVRTVNALMHPVVLVPEGRFDAEWLGRLADIADPHTKNTPPFSTVFGVVPTENAAVVFTASKLVPLRPKVVALVDGDAPGDGYVQALLASPAPPCAILQWPHGWTIENVVTWAIDAGGVEVLVALQETLPEFGLSSTGDLLALLRQGNDRAQGITGLKEDVIAHDAVCSAIELSSRSIDRIVAACEAIVSAATGLPSARMVKQAASTAATDVFRFQP